MPEVSSLLESHSANASFCVHLNLYTKCTLRLPTYAWMMVGFLLLFFQEFSLFFCSVSITWCLLCTETKVQFRVWFIIKNLRPIATRGNRPRWPIPLPPLLHDNFDVATIATTFVSYPPPPTTTCLFRGWWYWSTILVVFLSCKVNLRGVSTII